MMKPTFRPKGFGLPIMPLCRETKAKLFARARSYVARTVKGKAYGRLSAKALEVFRVLLYEFHNSAKGACFPGYEKIMGKANCCRETVAKAIEQLEALGLLVVHNRLVRVMLPCPMTGQPVRRVFRTSNAYLFSRPNSGNTKSLSTGSTSTKQTETEGQDTALDLQTAVAAFGKAIKKRWAG